MVSRAVVTTQFYWHTWRWTDEKPATLDAGMLDRDLNRDDPHALSRISRAQLTAPSNTYTRRRRARVQIIEYLDVQALNRKSIGLSAVGS
eukprot:scaffold265997_cov35-Tisochrysis_lutea.AAC.2